MKRPYSLFALMAMLIILFSSALGAAELNATYEEVQSLIIRNLADLGLNYPPPSYDVAFKVGTLTIHCVGDEDPPSLDTLKLSRSGVQTWGNNTYYRFKTKTKINGENHFIGDFVTKITYCCGLETDGIKIVGNSDNLLENVSISCPSPYPIKVEFFIVIKDISLASDAAGVGFQFQGQQSIGSFQLYYNSDPEISIPVNNGIPSLPFFETDYTNGSDNFINPVDETVYVELDIVQLPGEASINLIDAEGDSKAKVATAKLTLSGYERDSPQGIEISFTDESGNSNDGFRLRHTDIPSFIPFSLFLGDGPQQELVEYAQPIIWDDLAYGDSDPRNSKNLYVGLIDPIKASSCIAGGYADIIYVNITPRDSNLIGM